VLVFCPLPEETKIDYGRKLRKVRATTMGIMRFEPVGESRCKVTVVQHGNLGGIVPERVMTSKIPLALSGIITLQQKFERDEEVDGAERSQVEDAIKTQLDRLGGEGGGGGGGEKDEELVPPNMAKFGAIEGVERHQLEHPDHRVQLKKYAVHNDDEIVGKFSSDAADSSTRTGTMITLSQSSVIVSKKKREDGELVVGSVSAIVDASIERCAAWAFAEAARLRTKDGDGSHRVRCEVRPEGSQSQVVDTAYRLPGGKLLACECASIVYPATPLPPLPSS
jgi:hypothetical protein